MSSNPYENEPGFDDAKSASDKLNMEQYKCKVGRRFNSPLRELANDGLIL
jgi:hypothetical protein